jgi:hypothetical protein
MSAASEPAYDPVAVARVLVTTGDKLIELMTAETGLLQAAKTAELALLTGEKKRLSEIFQAGWRQLQGSGATGAPLPAALAGDLRHVALRLAQAAVENEEVLAITSRAAELVLAAVARAIESQRPQPTYTARLVGRPAAGRRSGIGFSQSA